MAVFRNREKFLFIFVLLTYSAFGQNTDVDLHKEIRLKPGSFRLDSLFKLTSQQTDVVFSYDANKLNTKQHIWLTSGVMTLEKILTQLKKEKRLSIKVMENHIIITPDLTADTNHKNTHEIPLARKTEMKKDLNRDRLHDPVSAGKIDLGKDSIYSTIKKDTTAKIESPPDSIPLINHIVNAQTDSSRFKLTYPPFIFPDSVRIMTKAKTNPGKNDSALVTKVSPLPKRKINKPAQLLFFFKSGISIDESLYTGVMAQIGIPILYATISANTNFKISYIRYGLGSSFKVTPGFRLHANFNLGTINRSGHFTDSIKNQYPIAVKGNLTRITVFAEFSINKKVRIQMGPVFNYLETRYYINSMPSSLSLFKEDGDRLFYAIKPPYLIKNTFSPNEDSNVKTWIGLQVNVLYFLNF